MINYLEANKEESILIVSNTKKMAYQIAQVLKKSYGDILFYLTTLTIPAQRKIFIHDLKEDLKKKRIIIISTQLIEAGVDISVHTIFKFLSPLDSIIQAGGRTNRNYEFGLLGGKVFVVNLLNEKGTPSYSGVYLRNTKRSAGDIKINVTNEIIKIDDKREEKDILDFSLQYFKKLKVNNLWQNIQNYLKSEYLKKFGDEVKLISDEAGKYTVFIETEVLEKGNKIKSIDIYNEYLSIKNRNVKSKDDLFKKIIELKKLQPKFSQFCISITAYEAECISELPRIKDYKIIPIINRSYYDLKLGLEVYNSKGYVEW